MSNDTIPAESLTSIEEWELIVPDDEILNLAKQIGLSIESVQRSLGLANEIAVDADQMTGWFVRKKRYRVLSKVNDIKIAAEKELTDISTGAVNYATSAYEVAREMEKALTYLAINGIKDSPTEEPLKLSRASTATIEQINKAIDGFVRDYSRGRVQKGLLSEGESAELSEGPPEGAPEETSGEEAAGEATGATELLGNSEQALEALNKTLADASAAAPDREEEIQKLLKLVEGHQSESYLERKKLNASVSSTVGTLERSLTESKLHHNRLEKNIVELSYRVSDTLERVQSELQGSISALEKTGAERLNSLHEAVEGHKAEYGGRLDSLSSDFRGLKESLDDHSHNYEELAKGFQGITSKVTELETKNTETLDALQKGVDELKAELAKSRLPGIGSDKHTHVLLFAWGVLVTVVSIAALIATLSR
jgi:hypothetical protein